MSLIIWIGGLLAALLPSRWWSSIDRYMPATRGALASSLLTVLAGGIFGVAGFVSHAQRQAGAVNDAVLTSTRIASAGDNLTTIH